MPETIIVIFAVWLLAISLSLIWLVFFFLKVKTAGGQESLINLLETVLSGQKETKTQIAELLAHTKLLEGKMRGSVQKVGLVRFNPFNETGGDHSFALALLDADGNGVVITGLHSRERTRIYMKSVKQGKSQHELSQEESQAIVRAQKRIS